MKELTTERLVFSKWSEENYSDAVKLWGNSEVIKYISARPMDIKKRFDTEVENYQKYKVQYFPIYMKEDGSFAGCCGLRKHSERVMELGFHLLPEYWRKGLAYEAASAVIEYAFDNLDIDGIFAGHNPNNSASAELLKKLGFVKTGDEFYKPTGLYHPSYFLKRQ